MCDLAQIVNVGHPVDQREDLKSLMEMSETLVIFFQITAGNQLLYNSKDRCVRNPEISGNLLNTDAILSLSDVF